MKLIITIANLGACEELMSVARNVGARGGTILNARGTGTGEDITFLGIHLVPEKEMLLIVASNEEAPGIVETIKNQPILNAPGAGIVFTLNIEDAFLLNSQ